jgi:glycosyltransferase involved in cell wall biosynthesis
MRICLVTGIFPPDIGGPASYVPQIAEGLQELGHHLELVTLADRPDESTRPYPFVVHRIRRAGTRPVRLARTVLEITRVARRSDLVFANGLLLEAAVAARIVRKPLVMKVVADWAWERATSWGLTRENLEGFQPRRQGWRAGALKRLRTRVVLQAASVIVPSQYLGRIVRGWGVEPERVVCIYNALDLPKSSPRYRLPDFEGATLCTVGRLVPVKGIEGLIHLLRELPKVRLVIVGEGPERLALEESAIKIGVSSRVLFTGLLDPSDVLGCLARSDLFVLNSTHEGLPHVILEAFEAGVPVLATAVGGVPEIIRHGENGWLVPPGQEEELRESVQRLLSDRPLCQKLVEQGRRTLQERFSRSRLLTETERVLATAAQKEALLRE